jgi:hypothetical protein
VRQLQVQGRRREMPEEFLSATDLQVSGTGKRLVLPKMYEDNSGGEAGEKKSQNAQN